MVEDSRRVRQRSLAQSVWSASSRASRRASHVTADSKGPSRMAQDQSGAGRPGSKEPGRGSFAPDIFGPPVGLAALLDHGVGDRHKDGDHDPLDADADHESDDEAGQKLAVAVE